MLVADSFLITSFEIYGKHIVYSDGRTWYPEACSSLGLQRFLHSHRYRKVSSKGL